MNKLFYNQNKNNSKNIRTAEWWHYDSINYLTGIHTYWVITTDTSPPLMSASKGGSQTSAQCCAHFCEKSLRSSKVIFLTISLEKFKHNFLTWFTLNCTNNSSWKFLFSLLLIVIIVPGSTRNLRQSTSLESEVSLFSNWFSNKDWKLLKLSVLNFFW